MQISERNVDLVRNIKMFEYCTLRAKPLVTFLGYLINRHRRFECGRWLRASPNERCWNGGGSLV